MSGIEPSFTSLWYQLGRSDVRMRFWPAPVSSMDRNLRAVYLSRLMLAYKLKFSRVIKQTRSGWSFFLVLLDVSRSWMSRPTSDRSRRVNICFDPGSFGGSGRWVITKTEEVGSSRLRVCESPPRTSFPGPVEWVVAPGLFPCLVRFD